MMTVEQLRQHICFMAESCRHYVYDTSRVSEVLFETNHCSCAEYRLGGDCGTYCDRKGFAIFRTGDGKIGVCRDSEDTSGHG